MKINNRLNVLNKNLKIRISMTSWPVRINNVATVFKTLLNNTLKADSYELTLSIEEFPNKENDLPDDLKELIKNNLICINWLKNDIRTFKKIIPIIKKYYPEEYLLIIVDDDILYNEDFIFNMVKNIKNNVIFCPINKNIDYIISAFFILNTKIISDDFFRIDESFMKKFIDDTYISFYLKMIKKIPFNNKYLIVGKEFNSIKALSTTINYKEIGAEEWRVLYDMFFYNK